MLTHNLKQVYLTPPGGMGNRLMAIFTAIAYCVLEKYDKLTIRWAVNDHCNTSIHSIIKLKNINNQIIETNEYVIESNGLISKNVALFGNGFIFQSPYGNINSILHQNAILQWIISNISNYVDFVPYQPIAVVKFGLHCRRSDWGVTTKNNHDITDDIFNKRTILDVEFEKFVNPIISGKPTFLSTDSIRTEEYFKSKHPAIIISKKTQYPISTNRNKAMAHDALIDLHTLAASEVIVRDSGSTFSYIAAIMNGGLLKENRLITWQRPVLQNPGPGLGI